MPPITISYIKEKWVHQGFQKYLKNTGWMFFGRIFTLGVSFIIGIYIARYLGPSNYGLLNYVFSFVGLFSFLASFGIDNIVNREIIKDHSKKDEIIGTGFYMKLIGSSVAIVSIFVISFFTTKDIFTLGLIWLFSLNFIPQAFNILETYFQSQVLSKKVVTAQVISNVISASLKILIIVLGKGIFWLIVVYMVETSVYAFVLLLSFRNFGNHIRRWTLNKNLAKTLLRDSWPLMLSAVAVGVYMKIDQVMIKNILGNEQAGVYSVAVKLSEVWYFIPSIICASLTPAIINSFKNNKVLFNNRMKKLYFSMFWLSVFIASIITIFSYKIVEILFGLPYVGAVPTLQIYVWAGISVSLGVALSLYLTTMNLTKISFYKTLIGAGVNITLNLILIPIMGITGAAIATLVSYTIATFGVLFYKESRNQGLVILRAIVSYK